MKFKQFLNYKIPQYCFEYNQTKKVSDLDLKKEIESQNIICIMATDAALRNFVWGFIDSAYKLYFDKK